MVRPHLRPVLLHRPPHAIPIEPFPDLFFARQGVGLRLRKRHVDGVRTPRIRPSQQIALSIISRLVWLVSTCCLLLRAYPWGRWGARIRSRALGRTNMRTASPAIPSPTLPCWTGWRSCCPVLAPPSVRAQRCSFLLGLRPRRNERPPRSCVARAAAQFPPFDPQCGSDGFGG